MGSPKDRWPAEARASFSISEVALRSGVSESYAYAEVKAGRLRATPLGGSGPMRVTRADEQRWIHGETADQNPASQPRETLGDAA
jgi:hypothetical protein